MAEYTIFSDDSGSGKDRFEAVTLLALPTQYVVDLTAELNQIVGNCGTHYTEWKKFGKRDCYTRACYALLGATPMLVETYEVKLQTLIWDKCDQRHSVVGRDDQSNKEYMYRVAIKDLVDRYRMTDIVWFYDRGPQMDMRRIATNVGRLAKSSPTFLSMSEDSPENQPLLQLADITAGLWRHYYEECDDGRMWFQLGRPEGCPECLWTERATAQYKLLAWYVQELRTAGTKFEWLNGRLKTYGYGNRPINVWPYNCRHDLDRAPQRKAG